jgi:hypothetical protein
MIILQVILREKEEAEVTLLHGRIEQRGRFGEQLEA